jgi:hypothetical protein
MAEHTAHHGDHGADAEYLPTPGSNYEHTDADVGSIVRFGIWLVVLAIATHLLLAGGFAGLISFRTERGEARYPLASGQAQPKPPAPVLQQYPAAEMTEFRTGDQGTLESYGWIDKAAGTVHIPIDEAIRRTLERGLPSRPQDGSTDATPGMMPTDASAGRQMERRRQ